MMFSQVVKRACLAKGEPIPNTDPDTGISYGIIPVIALDEDSVDFFQGRDLGYEAACKEAGTEEIEEWEGDGGPYLLEKDGVHAQLGTDRDVFVFKSKWVTLCKECSPCAPCAGYLLDSLPADEVRDLNDLKTEAARRGGLVAYCVPPDWFLSGEPPQKAAPHNGISSFHLWEMAEDGTLTPHSPAL